MMTEVAREISVAQVPHEFDLHVASNVNLVGRGTLLGRGDGEAIPFDPDNLIELCAQPFGEKTCAAIGIDQKLLSVRQQALDQVNQRLRNVVIGLSEDARTGLCTQGKMAIARLTSAATPRALHLLLASRSNSA